MAKEVIILSVRQDVAGLFSVQCLFWLTVPGGAQIPKPGVASIWLGASTQEVTDIQAGNVIEELYNFYLPASYSKAQVEAEIAALYASRQTSFTAAPKPGQFYGVFLDSVSGWSS